MSVKVVIVGGGLAGCVLASRLGSNFNVTVVYNGSNPRVRGIDYCHSLHPSVAGGLGGTTRYWHNVLIQIDDGSLRSNSEWLDALSSYVDQASSFLGLDLRKAESLVEGDSQTRTIQAFTGSGLRVGCTQFIPTKRFNAKQFLPGNVTTRSMNVSSYEHKSKTVCAVVSGDERLEGEIFIDATGGLGAISTLGKMQWGSTEEKLERAWSYEDHLCGFIGSLNFNSAGALSGLFGKLNLSTLWRWRRPVICRAAAGFDIALYFFPRVLLRGKTARTSRYLLSDLRNGINVAGNLAALCSSPADLYDLASFFLGDSNACTSYEVFAVLQHPEPLGSAYIGDAGDIFLHAKLPTTLQDDLRVAFEKVKESLGEAVDFAEFYQDFELDTGAHYSGTFPIGKVVDFEYRAFGFTNLFACGGAVLPETGYSNTGLTIAAQALALADVITDKYA